MLGRLVTSVDIALNEHKRIETWRCVIGASNVRKLATLIVLSEDSDQCYGTEIAHDAD